VANGEQRIVCKRRDGSLWLFPHPVVLTLSAVFLYLGVGFIIGAVHNLLAGVLGGLIGLAIGTGILAAGIWQIFDVRTIRFEAATGVLRLPGSAPLPFARIRLIVVEPDEHFAGAAAVGLVLDDGTQLSLGASWQSWRAELFARHLAGLVGCEAHLTGRTDPRLDPIARAAPWRRLEGQAPAAIRFARRAGLVLLMIGGASFLSGFFLSLPWAARLDSIELPLGAPQGIAVDSAGRIYVGSRAYRRLHRYHPDGSFDRAWHAEVGKGIWLLAVDANDRAQLKIGTRDGANRWIVTPDDRLEPASGAAEPSASAWQTTSATGPNRTLHMLHSFPASVARMAPGQPTRLVVNQGWLMLMVTSPLPAWLVAALGALLLTFSDRRALRTPSRIA
jgi:hypothetical protein